MNHWQIDPGVEIIHGEILSGPFSGMIKRDIFFTHCEKKSEPLDDYGYYMVSTEKWDKHWMNDVGHYLPGNINDRPFFCAEDIPKNHKKIEALANAVLESGWIRDPHLTASHSRGSPQVSDGRHRIWLIRALGIPAFLAAIPNEVVEAFIIKDLLC